MRNRPRTASRPINIRNPIASRLCSVKSMGHVRPKIRSNVRMTIRWETTPLLLRTNRRSRTGASHQTTFTSFRCIGCNANLTHSVPSRSSSSMSNACKQLERAPESIFALIERIERLGNETHSRHPLIGNGEGSSVSSISVCSAIKQDMKLVVQSLVRLEQHARIAPATHNAIAGRQNNVVIGRPRRSPNEHLFYLPKRKMPVVGIVFSVSVAISVTSVEQLSQLFSEQLGQLPNSKP